MASTRRATVLRVIGLVLTIALFLFVLARTDLRGGAALLSRVGPLVLVAVVPYALVLGLDVLSLRTLFARLGRRVRFFDLFAVRLSSEALNLSLPGGAVFAEGVGPVLYSRWADVPGPAALAGQAAKKWLLMRAHALYIALSAVVGYSILVDLSPRLLHAPGLPFLVLASALVPLGLSLSMTVFLGRGETVTGLLRVLEKIPIRRLKTALNQKRDAFANADVHLRTLARSPAAQPFGLLFAGWLLETLETLVLLSLLGSHLSYVDVLSFEAVLSLVRCMVVFAPAGLGVQDFGYVAFLSARGEPNALALAAGFVLLKRGKELFYVVLGALVFWWKTGKPRPTWSEASP